MAIMLGIFRWLQKHLIHLFKFMLFVLSILLIVQLFPKMPRFGYDYQSGSPWKYEDLIAPVDFAILKSQAEIEAEQQQIIDEFIPFFTKDVDISQQSRIQFETDFRQFTDTLTGRYRALAQRTGLLAKGLTTLDSIFSRGLIFLGDSFYDKPDDFEVRLVEGHVATIRQLGSFFTIAGASQYIDERLQGTDGFLIDPVRGLLQRSLVQNVTYNQHLSSTALNTALNAVMHTRGMVQQGEKIISRGDIVSPEKTQLIESYKSAYLKLTGESSGSLLLYIGQFLLVSVSMIVLALFLFVFRRDVFNSNRRILLILLVITILIALTSLVLKYNANLLFLIPVCIVPVVIRAFFDNRLALYVHIITIILVGFLIPRSFEFVFLQFIAGIIVIFSLVSLRRRSQLFSTVTLIFVTYITVYTGLLLAHGGTFADISWMDVLHFSIAAVLTLSAYPIIFLFERLFALPTDFSLLELSDTNNTLLRELAMTAPGTFQHAMQVANLAEEAIYAIGGNALLTRTGALYHDIGKMESAMYFIENQITDHNPHDEISYRESAAIIIEHVIKGIELARKHKLPEYIIDFIRTHHGTTTARYFFTMHLNENPDNAADKANFMYPGPKPFSRETAVVMMADAVEAASRSLPKHDESHINNLVDHIIDSQIRENQFDRAPITFKDIDTIRKRFKDRLMNMYHVRIAYPVANEHTSQGTIQDKRRNQDPG